LESASTKYKLIAPCRKSGQDILFEEVESIEGLPQDYVVPYNSLKDFFFPQVEVLLPEKKLRSDKRHLFFGARPCDIKALNFQDLFFGREPQDAYYITKRQNSLIISLTCNEPAKNCFCIFTKSGPYLEEQDNFDLQFTDLGEEYLVEAGNKKGKDFILTFKEYFSESNGAHVKKKDHCHKRCKMLMEKAYDMTKIEGELRDRDLNQLWTDLGLRCTNCGGCEFICPTCFCFNIQDFKYNNAIKRMRSWDSCTYEGYSRMAGGFNPYHKREHRIKKRFYCKLYHAKMWFSMYGCVGCGRCTSVCPVNLEMESFISSLTQGTGYKSLLKEL
jgi:ferredoxin